MSGQQTSSLFSSGFMVGQYEDDKMYKLNDQRMKTVNDCLINHNGVNPKYPHTGTPCSGKDLYQSLDFERGVPQLTLN